MKSELKRRAIQGDRTVLDNLATAAAHVRDGFEPDPGTSDLDDAELIWIGVSLGEWRRLDNAIRAFEWISRTRRLSGKPKARWLDALPASCASQPSAVEDLPIAA